MQIIVPCSTGKVKKRAVDAQSCFCADTALLNGISPEKVQDSEIFYVK
ncbi:hypothetical protein CLOSTHATH_03740 [Hungatella hathewayi DSM 13479]|uniref:Uncharacterized protein n=1 Tax=Hungatella hathewayi DSM 13479 TaxID=566550 RepID=D3AJE9_9FIRM|nr:hypothetical protein CLOSTHATH_03740 [Hungatella hathewayi DSM 13479]